MTTYWLSDKHMDSSVTSVEHDDDSMKPRQVKFEQTMTNHDTGRKNWIHKSPSCKIWTSNIDFNEVILCIMYDGSGVEKKIKKSLFTQPSFWDGK